MAALAPLWSSVAALLERGMTSMAATVAFGLLLAAEPPLLDMPLLPMAPWSCIMLDVLPPLCAPEVSYPLELPAAPELPDEPDEPDEPLLPVSPAAPLVPLLPLLPMPRQELHADSPTASASKPARNTLWCLCFIINSF
jgi:hypothetical protein